MDNEPTSQAPWSDYYKAVSGRQPRELLTKTIDRFCGRTGFAIDLGCGAGIETAELLRRGWQVLAIDKQPEALARVRALVPAEDQGRLTTVAASFEHLELPPSDLVWAGLSLPFCRPAHFQKVTAEMANSLRAGGRFAGDFFGTRHVWCHDKEMTFHTREQILALLPSFAVESLNEEEGARPTALQGVQHWHAFDVVARKR